VGVRLSPGAKDSCQPRFPAERPSRVARTSGASASPKELAWLGRVDRRSLLSAVTLICGDRVIAEEAVQEAMLRAWQRAKDGDPVDSWPKWILTVALNQTRSHFRRLRTERTALRHLAEVMRADGGDLSDRVTSGVDLVRAMSSLSRRQREVATLFYKLDMPISEVAATLDIDEGTVKTLLHRARSQLRPLVRERDPIAGNHTKRSG
jgi:RNA polymerase sigma factor (sigma-70 family)